MAHALVHSVGVVLGNTYVPLELAYSDVTGYHVNFLITSPINFAKIRRLYPSSRPDAIVTTTDGVPYSCVLAFLKQRQETLRAQFGTPVVVFGYKGSSYQSNVLKDAGIAHHLNVETLGVPKLTHHEHTCPWHKGPSKCAAAALNQMLTHLLKTRE